MTRSFPPILFAALLVVTASHPVHAADQSPPWAEAVLDGPPARYALDVEHYRFHGSCDLADPSFYPVPCEPVTRDTYLQCVEAQNPADIARTPNRGMDGPRVFMPVLVKYVQTGEQEWASRRVAGRLSPVDAGGLCQRPRRRVVSRHP